MKLFSPKLKEFRRELSKHEKKKQTCSQRFSYISEKGTF